MKKYGKYIVMAVLLAVFAFTTYCAVTGCFESFENEIARFLNPNHQENIVPMIFSTVGEYYVIIAIIAVLILIPSSRVRVGLPAGITTLVSVLANEGIKKLICRERPVARLLQNTFLEVHGYSFPSGHAMNSAAMYVCAMLLMLPLCREKWQKILTVSVGTVMPLGIGLSRVYFSVHFVSDVFGGWCLGSFFGILGATVYLKLKGNKADGKNFAEAEISGR